MSFYFSFVSNNKYPTSISIYAFNFAIISIRSGNSFFILKGAFVQLDGLLEWSNCSSMDIHLMKHDKSISLLDKVRRTTNIIMT